MSFLHKIWDETLAGPTPESGLGKLRKYNSFAATRSAVIDDDASPPPPPLQLVDKDINNGSIMIPINNYHRNLRVSVDTSSPSSLPSSPSGSITPTSPFTPSTPTTSSNLKKLTRKKLQQNSKPKPPNGYDWIVLSALDR